MRKGPGADLIRRGRFPCLIHGCFCEDRHFCGDVRDACRAGVHHDDVPVWNCIDTPSGNNACETLRSEARELLSGGHS